MIINFDTFSLTLNCLLFIAAGGIVWVAGVQLSKFANTIAKKTGTGDVVVGMLLLGGVTSLPEIVTTISASSLGYADIAINNLFGGVALQVTVLVAGDFVLKKKSISAQIDSPVVQLQGFIVIFLLSIAACTIIVHDVSIVHIGIGSFLILFIFISSFYFINYFQFIKWWDSDPDQRDSIIAVKKVSEQKMDTESSEGNESEEYKKHESLENIIKSKLALYILLCAVAILVSGYTVVQTGQAIAHKTFLSTHVVGAIFIALSTSLPELSTTISSVGLGSYRLAFSNIFGTNIFTVGFVFIADIFYNEGAVLNAVNDFSLFGAILGILLTSIYLIGLSIRIKQTVLHIGYDSLIILLCYIAGIFIMFTI